MVDGQSNLRLLLIKKRKGKRFFTSLKEVLRLHGFNIFEETNDLKYHVWTSFGFNVSSPYSWLIKDGDFVLEALRENWAAFEFIDPDLKSDRELVFEVAKHWGQVLEYADPVFRADRDIVLAAVKNNGWALKYADPFLQADPEIAREAVKESRLAWNYVDSSLKANSDFMLSAIIEDAEALTEADKSLKTDPEFVIEAVKQNWRVLEYVDPSLRAKPDFVIELAKQTWSHSLEEFNLNAKTKDLSTAELNNDELIKLIRIIQSLARMISSLEDTDYSLGIEKAGLKEGVSHLASYDWKDIGFEASPEIFAESIYGFHLQNSPLEPPFISPFHEISLEGHPEIIIPWSDPYLLMEWEAFLKSKGIEIIKKSDRTKYNFNGLTVLEAVRVNEQTTYYFRSPFGVVKSSVTVETPSKPEVKVNYPENPKDPSYSMTVYGREIEVLAYFPESMSSYGRTDRIRKLGETYQQIPESMLSPILDGVDQEEPLTITMMEPDEIEWLNVPKHFITSLGGTYSRTDNSTMFLIYASEYEVFHEIGGHAYADFIVSDDNDVTITMFQRSALRDYYGWKLDQIFSPEELTSYKELLARYVRWRPYFFPENPKELDELLALLKPFREKALTRFVSEYAIEGKSIEDQMEDPSEDFAEVMFMFFVSLLPRNRAYWEAKRSREPLLNLIALDYLFHEYGVSTIGNIDKEDVYSKEAFQEVLGIDLN